MLFSERRKLMELSETQRKELTYAVKHSHPGYIRVRALALLNLAEGLSQNQVAKIFQVSRQSVSRWKKVFQTEGIVGLRVHPGRGRKSKVSKEEVEEHIRQSPFRFGLNRTRWTLQALAEAVPCLKGFSAYGVQKVLRRVGYAYKRGQPHLHSPDPLYVKKNEIWIKP